MENVDSNILDEIDPNSGIVSVVSRLDICHKSGQNKYASACIPKVSQQVQIAGNEQNKEARQGEKNRPS